MRDLAAAELADLFFGRLARDSIESRPRDFAQPPSGSPTTCTSAIFGMRVQKLLDLARIDVLAAANDHVLERVR